MIREFIDVTTKYNKILTRSIKKASAPYADAMRIIATKHYIEFLINHPLPTTNMDKLLETLWKFEKDAKLVYADRYGQNAFNIYLKNKLYFD